MKTDAELLRAYAEEKSETAFGELVGRQVNLVYSVALRQCGGDASLAQDVTQQVFTDLARKARQLSDHAMLGGWLCRSAWFAASNVVRVERRRRAREEEAQAMQDVSQPAIPDADWKNLAPMLDEAVGELAERDRDAVVARFFEGKSFGEIGGTLRLTEDAARMRVERALDRLRAALGRRGIMSSTAALGVALANQVAATVPAGIAASVTGTALAAAATTTSVVGVWGGFFVMNKLQMGTIALLAVAGLTVLTLEVNTRRALAAELTQVRAPSAALAALPPVATGPMPVAAPVVPPLSSTPGSRPAYSAEREEQDVRLAALLAVGMKPSSAWENLGRATPADALETMLWAWHRQDFATLGTTLAFNAAGKAALDAWFAMLPGDVRAKYGTPEHLIAPAYAGSGVLLSRLQIAVRQNGENRLVGYKIVPLPPNPRFVPAPGQLAILFSTDSDAERPDTMHFVQDSTGWRQGPLDESMARLLIERIDPTTGGYLAPKR